jgi:DNA polymerase-3 subunit delta
MDSLSFIEASKINPEPFYVLFGDDDFLKRQVVEKLRAGVFGATDNDFGFSSYEGESSVFSAIRNELETLAFFGPRRLIVIRDADPFVTRYRTDLEKYLAQPAAGILVLQVKSCPSNTRLYKLAKSGVIACSTPAPEQLLPWCRSWSVSRYGKELTIAGARLLVNLVGTEMGLLDQELSKLASYVGPAAKIDEADVDQLVGNCRAANTFKILGAAGSGRPGEALAILDRLFEQGEEPLGILGALSYQLRQLARAGRLHLQGVPLYQALDKAEIPPFARRRCEEQLRHLGPERVGQIYDWLLDTDLGLKGGSSSPPRLVLERLVVRLAHQERRQPSKV